MSGQCEGFGSGLILIGSGSNLPGQTGYGSMIFFMSGTARERDEYDKVNRVCGTELDNFADLNSKSYLY